MFNFFPWTNNHQLNLDWILEQLVKMPLTVNNTHPDPSTRNINLPTVSGMSSWNGIGADGAGNVDPVELWADLNLPAVGFHIYRWEDPATLHNPFSAAENNNYMTGLGGGLCFSSYTLTDFSVQIAINNGSTCWAVRMKESGNPWSVWSYQITAPQDVSSNITLGIASCMDMNKPYYVYAMVCNGHASVMIEGSLALNAGDNDFIAAGLPIPAASGLGYTIGLIQDTNTTETRPARFIIDQLGDLRFSYMGSGLANDVISIRAEYTVK